MSHTLARLRVVFGDPILVRSGRGMVLTPRAVELRGPVRMVVEQTQALLVAPGPFDPARLERTFVIRAADALVGTVGPRLAAAVSKAAPCLTLAFAPEGDGDDRDALRGSEIDLSIHAAMEQTPDIEQLELFEDSFVGVVRVGHPILKGSITPKRFAEHNHAVTSRHGNAQGPIDHRLAELEVTRHVALVAPTYYAAAFAAASSNLVASIPKRLAEELVRVSVLRLFAIPLDLPRYTVIAAWHRRFTADPAHAWLRDQVATVLSGSHEGATA